MSLFVDKKFVSLVGMKLERFKQKQEYVWNCRCPICKDSKKSKIKARGYFYRKKGDIFFSCHNCNTSMSLGQFLKSMDLMLYQQYQLEIYADRPRYEKSKPDMKEFLIMAPRRQIDLPDIASLPPDHFARKYVAERKIPVIQWKDLYYAEDFLKFCEATFDPSRIEDKGLLLMDKRLVIPSYDEKGGLLCVQGRALSKSSVRYITIKTDEDSTKVFGLNKVNFNKKIYVLEGPIDSMFLPNAIATMDSALYRVADALGKHQYVFVYDNEPRNKQLVNDVRKTIERGFDVCVWPSVVVQKDINDMVLAGLDVQDIVDKHTFSGLRASLELETWRKV